MEELKSKRITLPKIFFTTDREEIKDIPIGIPYIFSDESMKSTIIMLLEYEVVYKMAIESGYPFNFKRLLKKAKFKDITKFPKDGKVSMAYGNSTSGNDVEYSPIGVKESSDFRRYIEDASVYVDIQTIKDLNIFPVWMEEIERAVEANIQSYAVYDHMLYNKKLGGMYGALSLTSPKKNVIIIDISGSIPRAVSATILALSKHLSEAFYADILITGSKSTLYDYSEVKDLDINKVYQENGTDNDQVWFRRIVENHRVYKTVIAFGDYHSPSMTWYNSYNKGATNLSTEEGKEISNWEVEQVISFDTRGAGYLAGYAEWFEPKTITRIKEWVIDLN